MRVVKSALLDQFSSGAGLSKAAWGRRPTIVVVDDGLAITAALQEICDYLDVAMERISSYEDLGRVLLDGRPMAVVAKLDAFGQDGCHVMKTVANYDASLPVLMLTGPDLGLAGAADAVEEVWGLSCIRKRPTMPGPAEIVEFLFQAGLKGRCLRLMPT